MVRQTATEKSTGPTLLVGVDVLQTLGGVAGTQARVPGGCACGRPPPSLKQPRRHTTKGVPLLQRPRSTLAV